MKYAIDRIIDNIAVLENIETKEKKEVNIDALPENVKEGSILIEKINYILDLDEEEKRREILRARLDRLKKIKKTSINENK